MTIMQRIVCDDCGEDIDTGQHTVLVFNNGRETIRKHFHNTCFFDSDVKGVPLFKWIKAKILK